MWYEYQGQIKFEGLLDTEFANASPFAPAVDPLYSMACTARNELLGEIQSLQPDADLDDRFIVDVRRTRDASARPLPEKDIMAVKK
jgi:hypothetical protein